MELSMDNQNQPELSINNSKDVIAYLSQQFPHCFSLEGEAKPLKVGIFQDIVERLGESSQLSKTKLRLALRSYTMSWRYLYSIKAGANRVDLDGNHCEPITDENIHYAQEQLKASKAKVQAKRIAEGKTAKKTPKPKQKPRTQSTHSENKRKPSKPASEKMKNVQPVKLDELQIGGQVKIVLGSKPVTATVISVEKEHIRVKVASGIELTVTSEHVIK